MKTLHPKLNCQEWCETGISQLGLQCVGAASGGDGAAPVSKQEKERQRKERQKQRKLVELESTLQTALDKLSKKGLRWEQHA
jgi:hypothetical protein